MLRQPLGCVRCLLSGELVGLGAVRDAREAQRSLVAELDVAGNHVSSPRRDGWLGDTDDHWCSYWTGLYCW